mmetsp:Transcript_9803/g.36570  ORF Transcript_9803/g.36570 Transcript_9803/m.36570 type:complete len:410 (-) Transcript_9803:2030-3259(-)
MRRFQQNHIITKRNETFFRTHHPIVQPPHQYTHRYNALSVTTSTALRRFAKFHQQIEVTPSTGLDAFIHSNSEAIEKHGIKPKPWLRVESAMVKMKLLIQRQVEALQHTNLPRESTLSGDERLLANLDSKHQYMTVHFFHLLERWNSFLLKGSFEFERCKLLLLSRRYEQVQNVVSSFKQRIEDERNQLKFLLTSHHQLRQVMHNTISDKAVEQERRMDSWDSWKSFSLQAAPWVVGACSLLLAGIGGLYAHGILSAMGVAISKTPIVTAASIVGLLSSQRFNEPTQSLVSSLFDQQIKLTAEEQQEEMELLTEYVNRISHRVGQKIFVLDHLVEGFERLGECLLQASQLENDLELTTDRQAQHYPPITNFQHEYVSKVISYITSTWNSVRETCEGYESTLRKEIILNR